MLEYMYEFDINVFYKHHRIEILCPIIVVDDLIGYKPIFGENA